MRLSWCALVLAGEVLGWFWEDLGGRSPGAPDTVFPVIHVVHRNPAGDPRAWVIRGGGDWPHLPGAQSLLVLGWAEDPHALAVAGGGTLVPRADVVVPFTLPGTDGWGFSFRASGLPAAVSLYGQLATQLPGGAWILSDAIRVWGEQP